MCSQTSPTACAICRLHASLSASLLASLQASPEASLLADPEGSPETRPPSAFADWGVAGEPLEGPEPGALLIGCSDRFLLRHHPLPSPLPGWLLLDARRHLGGPAEFNAAEAAAFGAALQQASALVRQLTGCERVYALAFGEGARHLHMHLVPRHAHDPESEAWRVADLYRAIASGARPPAAPEAVRELVGRARRALAGARAERS